MRRRWLGMVLLAPLLLGGCGDGDTTSATAQPTSGAQPWVVVSSGSATPSPSPSGGTGTVSPFPSGFLPLRPVPPAPTPTGTYSCPPVGKHGINGADAVAGATSATVTWYNPGGDDLVDYRITAISQDALLGEQRDIGWTVVTPGETCGFMTATVTGLDRDTRYVLSVDAVQTRVGSDGTYAKTVARSQVVRTTV